MKKDKKVINQNLEKSQEELLTQEKEQEEQLLHFIPLNNISLHPKLSVFPWLL